MKKEKINTQVNKNGKEIIKKDNEKTQVESLKELKQSFLALQKRCEDVVVLIDKYCGKNKKDYQGTRDAIAGVNVVCKFYVNKIEGFVKKQKQYDKAKSSYSEEEYTAWTRKVSFNILLLKRDLRTLTNHTNTYIRLINQKLQTKKK